MKNFPLVVYDEESYFKNSKYKSEDLYDLQKKILVLIDQKSKDIGKDVYNETKIDDKEIQLCLRYAFQKNLVKRERVGRIKDVPLYRYFT
ncbi:hypothetical protein [Nitrosopumilus sp.]|uniref:hypothetical protein n=1 Tax=Nitrosopumilus sp. TaxID=2024843 RepID=UPI0029312E05|nr:hypothetical protein [Nitrosopumilus sp.]